MRSKVNVLKIVFLLSSVLCTHSLWAADPLSEKTRIEFAASAHQALLSMRDKPEFQELVAGAQKLELEPSHRFEERRWDSALDESMHQALAVYDLALQVRADETWAMQQATTYLKPLNSIASFADYYKNQVLTPSWVYAPFIVQAATCTNGIEARDLHTKKMIPKSLAELMTNGIAISWRDGRKVYDLQSIAPLPKAKTNGAHLLISVARMNSSEDAIHVATRTGETTSYFFDTGKKKIVVKSSKSKYQIRYDGDSFVRFDLLNKTGEAHATNFYAEDGQRQRSVQTIEGDNGMDGGNDLAILRTYASCSYVGTDLAKAPLHDSLRKIINDFSAVFNQTETLRLNWLRCLGQKTARECVTEDQAYHAADSERDQAWRMLVDPKALPHRPLVLKPIDMKLVALPEANSTQTEPRKPISTIAPPPFAIPERDCTYVQLHDKNYAYCDGGMICSYEAKGIAKCSDGSVCRTTASGQASCR